jgi:ribosomal protein S18 acetylase RimI-like enzyme
MTGPPVAVRVATEPRDLQAIGKIDPSFATSRIYRIRRSELGFWLDEEDVSPAVHKAYNHPTPQLSDRLFVASVGTEIVGCGELRCDEWSARAEIDHLVVSSAFRRLGVGRSLLGALDGRARQEPCIRCLWLETQNINYPAVQFYRRMGFRLCGLDETLYRPGMPGLVPGEVALYFARDL